MVSPTNIESNGKDDVRQALLGEPLLSASNKLAELFPEIIGGSLILRQVLDAVCKISRSHSSVLILGESGTGKELIASAIHRLSPRHHKSFVAINCNAIPENLMESELFGHRKGAFTGADTARMGHFGQADGGTIFLDEIGDMPLNLQAKLLRVLQDKSYFPIGATAPTRADVRVLAATNVDLTQAILDQKFREDLYYRLNVLPIKLPPLRERKEDIPDLLNHFANISSISHQTPDSCWFNQATIEILCEYSWPGNIRQLQNLVERLVVMKGSGEIFPDDLPFEYVAKPNPISKSGKTQIAYANDSTARGNQGSCQENRAARPPEMSLIADGIFDYPNTQRITLPPHGVNLPKLVESIENDLIRQALSRTNSNKNQASKLLGLNRTTLVERLKKRKLSKEAGDT